MTETLTMDINTVMQRLPHRYPFLLVDRVLECISGKTIKALKNVTINEPFFPGHFPHRPVGILAFVTANVYPDDKTQLYFVGIDKARFRKPVEPGDQLVLKAELQRSIRGIWRFSTVAEVNGEEAVSADVMVAPGVNA